MSRSPTRHLAGIPLVSSFKRKFGSVAQVRFLRRRYTAMTTREFAQALERVTASPFTGHVHAKFENGKLVLIEWGISDESPFADAEIIRRRLADEVGFSKIYGPMVN